MSIKNYILIGTTALTLFFNSTFSLNNEQIQLKAYQNYFNNVYKSQSYSKMSRRILTSTIFNYEDKEDKSYYIGVAHGFDGEGSTTILTNEINDDNLEAKVDKYLSEIDISLSIGEKDKIIADKIDMISYKELIPGEEAYLVGYPAGDSRCVKKTNISGTYKIGNIIYVSIDEPVVGGVSGSPVFVERGGKLVLAGIVSRYNDKQLTSLAVPTDYFQEKTICLEDKCEP